MNRNFEKLLFVEKQGENDNLRTVFEMKFSKQNISNFLQGGSYWDKPNHVLLQVVLKSKIKIPFSEEIERTSEWKKFSHLLHILLESWKLNLFEVAITTKQTRNSAEGHQDLFAFSDLFRTMVRLRLRQKVIIWSPKISVSRIFLIVWWNVWCAVYSVQKADKYFL